VTKIHLEQAAFLSARVHLRLEEAEGGAPSAFARYRARSASLSNRSGSLAPSAEVTIPMLTDVFAC